MGWAGRHKRGIVPTQHLTSNKRVQAIAYSFHSWVAAAFGGA
jgi:hypothetical protein